jgi:hypothetical protein
MNAIARLNTIDDLMDEYLEKDAGIKASIETFEAAKKSLEMSGAVMGTYVGPLISGHCSVHENHMRRQLLQSAWKAVYNRLPIERIASANDKRKLDQMLADPPPFTIPNIKAQFGPYFENPRAHILRGLAEVFCSLDPSYKSHTKVKIGVKGLPKRVIVSNVGGYGSYGRDRLRDILNALAAYQGKPLVEYRELSLLIEDGDALRVDREVPKGRTKHERDQAEETETIIGRDVWLRTFGNGNGHLFFGPESLRDINRGLAEFYGDVLPDVDPDAPEKAPSTAVAKDLQFYWTPKAVIDAALDLANVPDIPKWHHNPPKPERILEPSCGDGRILDELRRRGHSSLGIEYHAVRHAQAQAKGHRVMLANFLECPPSPDFDTVVMNPPFYGRHYVKHVRHALKFLKPGGTLVAILPATAHYDHKELEGEWRDLPIASFAEAGTNFPTGMLRIRKPA